MKASIYNIYHNRAGQASLIWNTLTGAFLQVDPEDVRKLSEGRVRALTEDKLLLFSREGLIIPSSRDELADIEAGLRTEEECERSGGGFYRILVTTGCNASCAYCFERRTDAITMDGEKADAVAAFIAARQQSKPALIEWSGGEPLINHRAISCICGRLKEEGCEYSSVITTNGSLWNMDLIRVAKEEWRLKEAQITLDGVGEVHERIKGLPNGAFRDTIESINHLLDAGIKVRIRINHYKGEEHESLARWIASEFRDHPGIIAYAEPGYAEGEEYPEALMKEVLGLNMILKEAGLIYKTGKVLPRRRRVGCFACDPRNYTIAPDGKIYNCSHNMSEEQCVGDVVSGICAGERPFLRRQFEDKCRECRLLPVCMGGCRSGELKTAAMTQCPPFRNIISELMELHKESKNNKEEKK